MKSGAPLSLRGISKFYGPVAAVRNLDLNVAAGEFVTLLGASGSGKTTALMLLAGFIAPSGGSIEIAGRPVTDLPPAKRNLGVVFQNYSLFPHLTIAENIAFPLQMRRMGKGDTERRVREMLELVKLPEMGSRLPRELSGGQQQRIALARALVFEPQALLMDEPLGALDKNLREHMQLEIKRLQASQGATVLFVTHDQEEALTMSDRVAVMQHGRVAQIAPPADLYERPASRWVAAFVGQSNFLAGTLESPQGEDFVVRLGTGEAIRARGSATLRSGQRVLTVLRPEKVAVRDGAAPPRDAGAGNTVRASIANVLYLGHTIKLTLRCDDQADLVAQMPNDGRAWHAGMQVVATWAPESVWLVPDHEDEPA